MVSVRDRRRLVEWREPLRRRTHSWWDHIDWGMKSRKKLLSWIHMIRRIKMRRVSWRIKMRRVSWRIKIRRRKV